MQAEPESKAAAALVTMTVAFIRVWQAGHTDLTVVLVVGKSLVAIMAASNYKYI